MNAKSFFTTAALLLTLASYSRAAAPTTSTAPAPLTATTGEAAPLPTDIKLVSLFDGKSLNGWLTQPRPLGNGNLTSAFLTKLSAHADPLSSFLFDHLDDPAKAALDTLSKPADAPVVPPTTGKAPPVSAEIKKARADLLTSLNNILLTQSLYDDSRFAGVKLRDDTKTLLDSNPKDADLARLNRALLEDAWPDLLKPTPLVEWTVKNEDGGPAIASVGVGRGTLFTANDYSHYRLIFDIRHVGSEPKKDHQPCVLVFCMRPAPGEKFLDALGGVQFQVPSGGHWDYRPGFNVGNNVNFTNLLKPKFNNHEWARVEILVDASAGTARMATASPIGTKAVEILDFKDPAAGRPGPIALQMHNDGLYDEYRNIQIEIDPTTDDLLTTR